MIPPHTLKGRVSHMLGLALLAIVAACAPAIRPDKVPDSFAWFDLVTDRPEVAQDFYGAVFGWRFSDDPNSGAKVITGGNQLIGGLVRIDRGDTASSSRWQPVLTVADTQAAVKTSTGLGAHLVQGPVETPEGSFAVIRDNSRALLTLYDGQEGIPLAGPDRAGTWAWVDLFTNKPASAQRFYAGLSGFQAGTARDSAGQAFTVFTKDGVPRGGLVSVPASQIEPNWLPYVLVRDLDQTIGKARELGASVLAREPGAAILLDPTGAAVGIVTPEGVGQ